MPLTDAQTTNLRRLRDEIRFDEGGSVDPRIAGGQCGIISESVEGFPGLESFIYTVGCYTTDDDRLIYDHCFNLAEDGTVLDVTADQFHEQGDDIRLLPPGSPRHDRYRVWTDFDCIDLDVSSRAASLLAHYSDGPERVLGELHAIGPYVYMHGERERFRTLCRNLDARHPALRERALICADYE